MKKTIFFTVLLLCVQLVFAQNQVQDTFLGCRFYQNSTQVKENLKSKGYEVIEGSAYSMLTIQSITFGGYWFERTVLSFQEDVFSSILFMSHEDDIKQSTYLYKEIANSISNKYNGLHKIEKDNSISYHDGKIGVTAFLSSKNIGNEIRYYVILSYNLIKLQNNPYEDEM